MCVRNWEEEELAEGEKKTRGEENGKIGVIGVSRGEEEEQRKWEGEKEPDQKRLSENQSRRKRDEKGARGMGKMGQFADVEKI